MNPWFGALCRQCLGEIAWVESAGGKRVSIDRETSKGTHWLMRDGSRALVARAVTKDEPAPAGELLYTLHVRTCSARRNQVRERAAARPVDEHDLYGRPPPSARRDALPKSNPAAPTKDRTK